VEPLIKALKGWDVVVRRRAAEALGEIGDKRAVEPLIEALKDSDKDVQKGAAKALGEIGDERAVEPLIEALRHIYYPDHIGWEDRYMGEFDDWIGDMHLQGVVERALVKIGEPAVEPLIQALKDGYSHVREGAAKALGEIGDIRAVEPLIQALKDEDSDVRKIAAEALGKMGWKPGDDTDLLPNRKARTE